MKRFVKVFKGNYILDIENSINETARKCNLSIISVSNCINQGVHFFVVVFEKKSEE